MAYNDVRTPEAHAAVLGEAELDLDGNITYSAGHMGAAVLHGWEAHKRATTESFTLIEGYYQAAIVAALDGNGPYEAAMSPYAASSEAPPIGPGKHLVEADALTPWVTFEDLALPSASTQVFDYVVKAYGYLLSTPTTRVLETVTVRVSRDGAGAASLLSTAAPFADARLRINVTADDVTIDVRAHASQDWVWDTEARRGESGVPGSIQSRSPDGTLANVSMSVLEGDVVEFPPSGAADDGPRLQALLDSEAAGLRRKIVWTGGIYTFDTGVSIPPGPFRSLLNQACDVRTTITKDGNPNNSLFKTIVLGPQLLPSTTLIAAVALGALTVDVMEIALSGIAASAEIMVGTLTDGFGGVFRRTVIGAPAVIPGGFRVTIDRPATAEVLNGASVEVIDDRTYTVDIDGGGASLSGDCFRYFQLAFNKNSRVRNFRITDVHGIAGQVGSWDCVGYGNIAENIVGDLSDGTLIAWAFETNESSQAKEFHMTGLGDGFLLSGDSQCTVSDSTFGFANVTGTAVYMAGEQNHPSLNNTAKNIQSTGGLQGAKFAGTVSADVGDCPSICDQILDCKFLRTKRYGVYLGDALVSRPVVHNVSVSPLDTTLWSGIEQLSGVAADADLAAITAEASVASGIQYLVRAIDGLVIRGVTLTNVALVKFDSAVTLTAHNVRASFASDGAAQWVYAAVSGCRLRLHESRISASGAYHTFVANGATWCVELHDTDVTLTAGMTLGVNDTPTTSIRLYGSSDPSFAGSVNLRSSRASVALNGTEQAIPFPDARAGDVVSVSTTTVGGAPAARQTRLLAGTGAYVTGAAGDTSTVQVSIT